MLFTFSEYYHVVQILMHENACSVLHTSTKNRHYENKKQLVDILKALILQDIGNGFPCIPVNNNE